MHMHQLADMSDEPILDPDLSNLIARTCLCQHVQRAGRKIGRRFDDAVRPLGINNWQFTILMALSRLLEPTMGELADALGMDRTTLTKNLKPLARDGLLSIAADPADARIRHVGLTPAGQALLAQAAERWKLAQGSFTDRLSQGELANLLSLLNKL